MANLPDTKVSPFLLLLGFCLFAHLEFYLVLRQPPYMTYDSLATPANHRRFLTSSPSTKDGHNDRSIRASSAQEEGDTYSPAIRMLSDGSGERKEDLAKRKPCTTTTTTARHEDLSLVLPNLLTVDYSLPFNAYYINLDESKGRRHVMDKTFGKLWGNRLHRIAGIVGSNQTQIMSLMGNSTEANMAWELHGMSSKAQGELGCILSHLASAKTAYLNGDEVALIMEDDVGPYYMPYWSFSLQDVVDIIYDHANTTWDTVQLSYTFSRRFPYPVPKEKLIKDHIMPVQYQHGTVAYLISRRGMEKILDKFFTNRSADSLIVPHIGDSRQIDEEGYFMSLMTENYIAFPPMFASHAKGSTLDVGSSDRQTLHLLSNIKLWTYWLRDVQDHHFDELD